MKICASAKIQLGFNPRGRTSRAKRVRFHSERGDQQEGRREIGTDVPKKGTRHKGQRGTQGDSGQLHVARAERAARWKKAKMTDGTKKGRICKAKAEIREMTPADVSETHLEPSFSHSTINRRGVTVVSTVTLVTQISIK